jgi:hypothetical protein
MSQEVGCQASGIGGNVGRCVRQKMIPREGGNRFSGDFKASERPAEYHRADLLAKVGCRANVRRYGLHILRHTFCSHPGDEGRVRWYREWLRRRWTRRSAQIRADLHAATDGRWKS